MNKPYFTTILLFMLAVCQFIMCVELQGVEAVHGNDKDSDINVFTQGSAIFFENPAFNSSFLTENVTKSISVINNDPERPNYKLTISGEITKDASIKPGNIDFGSVCIGEKTNKTVTIKSQTKPDFKINKISPSKPFINASITEEKNGEYVIKVALENNPEIEKFSGGLLEFYTNRGRLNTGTSKPIQR